MLVIDSIFLFFPFIIALIFLLVHHFRKASTQKANTKYIPIDILFLIYVFLVLSILYFPLTINMSQDAAILRANLVPFKSIFQTISDAFATGSFRFLLLNFLGNGGMFAPLALYLFFRFPQKRKKNFIFLILISILAEILQLVLGLLGNSLYRSFDVDDILLNLAGAFIAWFIAKQIEKNYF